MTGEPEVLQSNLDFIDMEKGNYLNGEMVSDFSAKTLVSQEDTNALLRKVYWWMFGALVVTGLTALYVANSETALGFVFGNSWTYVVLIIAELALVYGLSAAIDKMSASVASLMFLLYSILNGITLSSIFVFYELGSIATAFFVSAGTFGIMAIVGSVTKKDLTKIGNLCLMAVVGLIIASLVNLLIKNSVLELVVSCVGVVVFVGLTAYDAQKIKEMLYDVDENETSTKIAVLGALSLYLDFINIFLYLLRLFGRRK